MEIECKPVKPTTDPVPLREAPSDLRENEVLVNFPFVAANTASSKQANSL